MRTLAIHDGLFYVNGAPTYTKRAGFADSDVSLRGLLLNHRVVNGIFDDLGAGHDYDGDGRDDWAYADSGVWSAERNVAAFIEAMPVWREHGVIAFTIGLQGGNPFSTCPPAKGLSPADVDCGAFEPDGSLRAGFMERLARILEEAKRLDMVPIVNYFYQGGNRRVREDALGVAVDNASDWLVEHCGGDLIVDLANECDSPAYWPGLGVDRIHELIYRVRDAVDLYNTRAGKERRFLVGASLSSSCTDPRQLSALPASYLRSVDVLLMHGNGRTTEGLQAAIGAMRARALAVARRAQPIVINEDIVAETGAEAHEGDAAGDLAHLAACVALGVSWGNLIRSHQQVPCANWHSGSPAQERWLHAARELSGQPGAPSSVTHFYHHIRAL